MKKQYEQDGIIHYYGNLAGYIEEDQVVVDAIFDKPDLREFIEREIGKPVVIKKGLSRELSEGANITSKSISTRTLGIKIYQLNKETPLEVRFISLRKRDERGFSKPNRCEYDLIYEGEVEKFDLEDIWERFARSAPKDFGGHALSISDIVEFSDGEDRITFYLEPTGFTEINFE